MPNQLARGTDAGYAFLGPAILKRTQPLQTGITLGSYQQSGVIVSETPHSPWRHATFLVQETIVTDAEGRLVREVGLCETVDADGDLTWSILWRRATGAQAAHVVEILCAIEASFTQGYPVDVTSTFAPPTPMPWAL